MIVMRNVIRNAALHAAPATLVVTSVEHGLAFTDSGPGIAHADQPRVYGRFEKLAQSQESPGAGVGLFIAKRLAERMKARLRLESTPGQGSVFFLVLPVAE